MAAEGMKGQLGRSLGRAAARNPMGHFCRLFKFTHGYRIEAVGCEQVPGGVGKMVGSLLALAFSATEVGDP